MKRIAIFLLLASSVCCAQNTLVKKGATVYIEPLGGYENYLAAVLVKERVSLTVVTQKDKATFVLRAVLHQDVPSAPSVVVNNSATARAGESGNNQAWNQDWALGQRAMAQRGISGDTSVSIVIVDEKTSQIVLAYPVTRIGSQLQRASEDCAKWLRKTIEKAERT